MPMTGSLIVHYAWELAYVICLILFMEKPVILPLKRNLSCKSDKAILNCRVSNVLEMLGFLFAGNS